MPKTSVSLTTDEQDRFRVFVENLYVNCRNADSPHRTVMSISRDVGDLLLKVLRTQLKYDIDG